jgi:accessory colonization factor AcfC
MALIALALVLQFNSVVKAVVVLLGGAGGPHRSLLSE